MPPPLADQVATVTDAAMQELLGVWLLASVDEVTVALYEIMPPLIDTWSMAAAALAADWYDELREEKNIAGRFTAVIPALGDKGADALVGWATEPLRQDEPDFLTTRHKLEGGAQRRIVNSSRETIMQSSVADPKARGWARFARGETCTFCRLLVSRGGVYTQATAQFKTHDHCDCYAAPVWK